MIRRVLCILMKIIIGIILTAWIVSYIVTYIWNFRGPTPMVYEDDIIRYSNVTWPKRRIPRIIHQTYRTHDVPPIWNATVQSVLRKNRGDFEYRQWSHTEMDAFVKEREPEFYRNTYITYRHDMQRIDSFRYVLMFHIGGLYVDMDNGCNRPFQDLLVTLEALDPDAPHLAAFPKRPQFGVESDLIISTAGHPFHKQLISRLHFFNHHFIFHFWTMLVSAGPIYVSIQERFFSSLPSAKIRLLDFPVFRPMFIYKENGYSWIRKDAQMLFIIDPYINQFILYCKRLSFVFIFVAFYVFYKSKMKRTFHHIRCHRK